MGEPVEAEHSLGALDAGAGEHDVVAALGVVVLLAAVADQDVVPSQRVVLERGSVVALHQVEVSEPTLEPVVAFVTEHGVIRVAGMDEVVTLTGERLGDVVATEDEVVAPATLVQVTASALARRQHVVAVAALEDVVTVQVLEDVIAEASDEAVVAVTTLHPVVAVVAPDGVVTLAGPQAVVARCSVEDDVRPWHLAVTDGAIRHPGEQQVLVVLRRVGVVQDRTAGPQGADVEHEVGP